jgi:hypothetical protein
VQRERGREGERESVIKEARERRGRESEREIVNNHKK